MDKNLELNSLEDTSPLTTSTESETFDTWTVITDKANEITPDDIPFTPLTSERTDDDEEIGTDAVHVEVLKASDVLNHIRYNDIDDLSDGISIISESESAGRMSPHPELRKHLSELNMRFINIAEPPLSSTPGGSTPLNYEGCSERSSDTFHRVEPLLESNRRPRSASRQLIEPTNLQPTFRCGVRGLFYVGALLAVLAFISKLKYDAWESVLGTKTGLLTQKIDELELKNNLMRAEIDILAKQVNYLTTLSENQKYTSSSSKAKSNQPREKKLKVWPGNGNTIEEVEISPKDLKKPYKCNGHNNVDIAGVCIELPLSSESVLDSLGSKVRVVINENEYLSDIEKVFDKVEKMIENPLREQKENPPEVIAANKEIPTVPKQQTHDYIPHEHKPDQYDSKKHEKRDGHKKHNSKNDSGESKERGKGRRDKFNDDNDGSEERYKKEYRKNDKRFSMEYENAKREADGQWHEKLMQHRENIRTNNEKHRHDKNWYIERGDSREQARVSEQKYRGSGQR